MSKRKLLFIVPLALIILSAGFLFLTRDDDETASTANPGDSSQAEETDSAPEKPTDNPQAVGRYVDYNEQTVAQTDGTKVLFFHASWCPQCRALEADINNSQIPSGVTIFKVDYDSNQDLRQKHGVTIQTTLVEVDDNGNTVEKFVAYDSPTLESVKQNLLQ